MASCHAASTLSLTLTKSASARNRNRENGTRFVRSRCSRGAVTMEHPQQQFMTRAIQVAGQGEAYGEYRLGALVVRDHEIISEAYTALSETADPTAHAEVLAIRGAAARLGSRYLPDCFLYTTLEPCPMCTSAAIWAKMSGIVFGASMEDALSRNGEWRNGRFYSWRQIKIKASYVISRGRPDVRLWEEFMRPECLSLLPSPPA